MKVYVLRDDLDEILSLHLSEEGAKKMAQRFVDTDAKHNKTTAQPLAWKSVTKRRKTWLESEYEGYYVFVITTQEAQP